MCVRAKTDHSIPSAYIDDYFHMGEPLHQKDRPIRDCWGDIYILLISGFESYMVAFMPRLLRFEPR